MRGDIMQEIYVYDKNDNQLTHLTQWDKNVVIHFKDAPLDKATNVHFFNCNSKEAMVMSATYKNGTLTSQVPNDILTEPHTITGYIWVDEDSKDINYESKEHKSVYCFRIMVKKRPQPLNQVYEDQKEFITFDKILSDAKGYSLLSQSYAVGDTKTRKNEETDNAKYYSVQSQNSAQAASRSAQTAATSAQDASRSEQNAAASSNNADKQAEAAAKSASRTIEKATEAATSATEAESFAHGGTGTRVNEETDNAKYYYNQSHNNSEISKEYLRKVEKAGNDAITAIKDALDMDKPNFQVDLSTGNLMYEGGRFMFQVNKAGHLEWGLTV